jgi:hypothetical protein
LDGTGKRGEYIRHGLNYERWKANLNRLKKEVPHAIVLMHFVVSVFNLFCLADHIDEILCHGLIDEKNIGLTFLEWPSYLNVQSLPASLKKEAEGQLRSKVLDSRKYPAHIEKAIGGLIEFLWANDLSDQGSKFREVTDFLDTVRGENAWATFLELRPILSAVRGNLVQSMPASVPLSKDR